MAKSDFHSLNIAVLTISDTRELATDTSGDVLQDRITNSGHKLVERNIVKDDKSQISSLVQTWADRSDIDVIITTGGTGLTGRDITPEAIEPMFTKKIDGFSFLFHKVSFEKIGTSTLQSRAAAGLIGTCFVFLLPGSPNACKDGWDEILQYQLDASHKPCNFAQLLPRLGEV